MTPKLFISDATIKRAAFANGYSRPEASGGVGEAGGHHGRRAKVHGHSLGCRSLGTVQDRRLSRLLGGFGRLLGIFSARPQFTNKISGRF